MATKGMKSLLFSPKSFSSSSSISPSSPSRYGFSPSRPSFHESVMERTLDMVEPLITKWNTETTVFGHVASLFHGNRREARDFLKCVSNLHRAMQFLNMENSSSEKLVRAQNLMQIAMKRLQKEFYQILSVNRVYLDPESVSARSSSRSSIGSSLSDFEDDGDDEIRVANGSISEVEDLAALAMEDLRLIAECMISSGYVRECLKIYKIIRQSVVDEGIYRLGAEKISPSQIHKMDWEALELRINNWLNALRISVKTLFNGERILCDHVFAISDSIRESCFAEITKEGALILFEFPENVAKKSKKSPEKIFRMLDMYAAISNHWPEIDSIFSSNPTASIKSQAMTSLINLGDFVRSSFNGFESAVSKDSSKSSISGAVIQNLTTEVMNYLSLLSDYSNILADILTDSLTPPVKSPLPDFHVEFPDESPAAAAAVSHRVARLILVLLCKLDAKAKYCKDVNLANLFLANNIQYVVVKMRTSNLRYLLGDEWLTKHESMVKQFSPSHEPSDENGKLF